MLVECVPNFSEGRDAGKIDAVVAAIRSERDVRVLHVDSGEAANRTVVTVVGEAESVLRAMRVGIKTAAGLIDMRSQSGTHPRIGTTDVCPFVPLEGSSMTDCISLAEQLGERVGSELGIPVYLYARAARQKNRVRLPSIRRGEYESLEDKMEQGFVPDYGPNVFNARSGATVIGARPFLVAWNVNLNTKDVSLAREIARRLRTSGRLLPDGKRQPGRFRSLQADGWFIDEFGCSQVTFNILDYQTTPLASVYEACKDEAATLGIVVTGSELVGMVPGEALTEAGRHYLSDTTFDSSKLISKAIDHLGLSELSLFDPKERILELAYRATP